MMCERNVRRIKTNSKKVFVGREEWRKNVELPKTHRCVELSDQLVPISYSKALQVQLRVYEYI